MAKKPKDREARLEQSYKRLRTRDPICVTCGKRDPEHPEIYELHHVGQRKHHDDVVIECANCHRTLSDQQRDHVPPRPVEHNNMMTTIGHYLLGLADMFAMIVETLREFGEWLISEARCGEPA